MTVKELKEELNKYDENTPVIVRVDEENTPISSVRMLNSPEDEPYCKGDPIMEDQGYATAVIIAGWDF